MTVSFIKSKLPPLEEWEECELVECIGTPEEHADKFYRHGNFGIEVHDDGLCQAYVIVNGDEGEEPIMVKEGLSSPEEAIEFLNEESNGKALSDTGSSDEKTEEEPEQVAEVEVEVIHEPEPENEEEKDKDDKSEDIDMSDKKTESVAKADETSANGMPVVDEAKEESPNFGINAAEGTTKTCKSDTVAHAKTIQEGHNVGSSNGGTDDITHAKTIQEGHNVGSSNGGIDDEPHATKITLPPAQGTNGIETSSGTTPTFKSFSEMRAEREARKHRGLPSGYTPYNEATIRKTANDNAQRCGYKFGTDKDFIDGSEAPVAKGDHVNAGGAERSTSVSGFAKSARPEGLMSFSEMRSIMKSGRYTAGTMQVEYAPIAKAAEDIPPEEPMEDEEMPPMEEGAAPGDVPADGMPMAGGDGVPDMPPAEGGEDMPPAEDEAVGAPGDEPSGDILPPEEAAQMYSAASPVVQTIVSTLLMRSQGEGGMADEATGAPEEMGDGGLVGSDMGTALEGSDVAVPGAEDMGAPSPVTDPALMDAQKPQPLGV